MASRVRCPACSTIVQLTDGKAPVCPSCGFTGPVAKSAAKPLTPVAGERSATSATLPQAAPGLAAPSASTTPIVPALSPLPEMAAPSSAPAGITPRGKVVHPGIVVLLHIVTLGIYFFVFWWRTSREVDAATGERRAHPLVRIGVWLAVAGVALLLVTFFVLVAQVLGTLEDAQDETYTEDDFLRDLQDAGVGVIALGILAILVLLAGRICILVGQHRVWLATRDLQERAALRERIQPGLFLGLSILALVVGNGSSSPGGVGALGDLLGFLGVVTYLVLAALTQSHLNAVWQAPSATGWPPASPGMPTTAAAGAPPANESRPTKVDWVPARR